MTVERRRRNTGLVTDVLVAAICLIGMTSVARGADRGDAGASITAGRPGGSSFTHAKASVPGSRVTLGLETPVKPGSHYLWVQTSGPPLELGDRTRPELKLTVPAGADALGFLLVVADDQGIRTSQVEIPVGPAVGQGASSPGAGTEAKPVLTADAGDDQIGLVGRRITLNGSESQPRKGLSYRWIQLGGPEVRSPIEAASYFSFVPGAPGVYRFALVVAGDNRISAPDDVTVTVGLPPSTAAAPGLASPMAQPGDIDAAVRARIASLDDAAAVAGSLASAFEASSSRMDLYQNYAEVYSELSRRLDTIVTQDPFRRARWNAAFFEPLTQELIARMLTLGLDLRFAAGQSARLSDLQKQELKSQFDRTAKVLRSIEPAR